MTSSNKYFSKERFRYVNFPVITLSGKWLKDAVFKAEYVINIV